MQALIGQGQPHVMIYGRDGRPLCKMAYDGSRNPVRVAREATYALGVDVGIKFKCGGLLYLQVNP